MNTYDQLAFSSMPTFMLSAPNIADQSQASRYDLTNSGVTNKGQSIITGHKNSFIIRNGSYIDIDGNLGFFTNGSSLEFVLLANQPDQEIAIIADGDNESGIYLNNDGLYLKLKFVYGQSTMLVQAGKNIRKWGDKYYVRLVFSEARADIIINDDSYSIDYIGDPVGVSNLRIGQQGSNGYFLIDGLVAYESLSIDKTNYIDDNNAGYRSTSANLTGRGTFFNTYKPLFSKTITREDFIIQRADARYATINLSDENYQYFIIRTDVDDQSFAYKTDNQDWTFFSKDFVIDNTVSTDVLSFAWNVSFFDVNRDEFAITVEGISNGDIYEDSPAIMSLIGQSINPDQIVESITNCSNGVQLYNSHYDGTVGLDADIYSIEIVFYAHNLDFNYVYSSSSGSVSYGPGGSINGFTAWLNGELTTDLSSVVPNQWNHLVLSSNTPISKTFSLNNGDEDPSKVISYLLFTVYEKQLDIDDVSLLYSTLVGTDSISFEEQSAVVNESEYSVYAYTWSIIGAGGH